MTDGFFRGSLIPLGAWQKRSVAAVIAAPQEAAAPALAAQVEAVELPQAKQSEQPTAPQNW